MSVAAWGWLVAVVFALTSAALRVQLWRLRKQLPRPDVNVIDGYLFPSPSDPRWTLNSYCDSWSLGEDKNRVAVLKLSDNRYVVSVYPALAIEGQAAGDYWKAISREQMQQKLLANLYDPSETP